jgi:hypothetical protein
VEAIVPPAKDFQRQIDLRRSENLHIVMSSVVEESLIVLRKYREMSPLRST